ncbi:MAG: DUF3800 domain-containing protein [Proteobacteria bacterium]|nr:DUF3800 domain-containing protein [Pseudomonadota bacterium]
MDESGDPGFKVGKGSSSHFIVAMVRFDSNDAAESASRVIGESKQRLRINGEVKFSKSPDHVRHDILSAVRDQDFSVRVLAVEKARLYSERLKQDTDCFYNFFLRLLMSHDGDTLRNARIKLDGSGDRKYRRELEAYLRRQLSGGKIASLKFVDSKSDNLIQLADMCAGAVLRARRTDAYQDGQWLKLLDRRIENIWDFS